MDLYPVRVYCLKNGAREHLSKPDVVLEIPYGNGDDHAEGMTLVYRRYPDTSTSGSL